MRPFDQNGAFVTSVEPRRLRGSAIRGAGVTVLSGGIALAVQVVATVTLARLLSPGDFGLVAMVTTFSLLLMNFGWNGFTEAIIQRAQIDRFLVSNLFWINAGAGLALTVGFAAAGSLLALFYHDPRVARVAAVTSATILITSLSVEHLALLKRSMRFSATSANDIVSRIVSVAVSISLACLGWGYWALIAGVIAQPVSSTIGAWYLCHWLPSLPRRAAGTRATLSFALSTYGRFIANYCTWNLDNLLVGWRFGSIPLGFYKKAYDLFALSASQLSAPLTSVAVSALSRVDKNSEEYKRYLVSALGITGFVGMALGGDLTLIGKDMIRVLLGPQWGESGQIFMYFGPGIGIMLLYYTHGWIHLSIGQADRWLRWSFVEFTVTASLFILALRWGPPGIALAWTASFWILTFPALWYAGKPIELGIAPVFHAVWKYVASAIVAVTASTVVLENLTVGIARSGIGAASERVIVKSIVFTGFYLGTVVAIHRGFEPLLRLYRLVREGLRSVGLQPIPGVTSKSST